MKKYYIILILIGVFNHYKTQVKIGSDGSIDPSLILNVDNSSQGGVLYPVVELNSDLTDVTSPIKNPTEGLMVYHSNQLGNQKEGIYIWVNGRWRLVADNNNMVNDLVVFNTNVGTNALGTTVSSFQNMNTQSLNLFSNNIPDATYDSNGYINLPKGSYVVNVVIEFSATSMTSSTTIPGSNGVNLMNFIGKLHNPSTGESFGLNQFINVTLRNQLKKGQINFTFNFETNGTKSFIFALAHAPGGSFIAPIRINQYKIHVQSAK